MCNEKRVLLFFSIFWANPSNRVQLLKNEYTRFFKLMGKATYLETSNAERDIFEKYSLALQGRKLVFINEMNKNINEMNKNIHKNYEDRMKGLITDVSLYLRPLHKQSFEVDNLAGFILAGNSRLLVLVKQEEDVLFWSKFVVSICRTHLTTNRFGRIGFVGRTRSRTNSPCMST